MKTATRSGRFPPSSPPPLALFCLTETPIVPTLFRRKTNVVLPRGTRLVSLRCRVRGDKSTLGEENREGGLRWLDMEDVEFNNHRL